MPATFDRTFRGDAAAGLFRDGYVAVRGKPIAAIGRHEPVPARPGAGQLVLRHPTPETIMEQADLAATREHRAPWEDCAGITALKPVQ